MATVAAMLRFADANAGRAIRNAAIVAILAVLLMLPAVANRIPILFPDTIGYNRAGESALSALDHLIAGDQQTFHTPVGRTAPKDGISGSRSPYYGVALAVINRIGGVWLSAFLQSIFTSVALLLAMRRFGLIRGPAGWVAGVGVYLAGLGFFAVTLIPDVFLGVVILATTILLTSGKLPRGERWFWIVSLLAGMLFHRAFAAAALAVVIATLPWLRARWLNRRGLMIVAFCCLTAFAGHFAVGFATETLLKQPTITPPFVLARMANSPVLIAYLDEACPVRHFVLCRYRSRLPMAPNTFLWFPGTAGVYPGMSSDERIELGREANSIVVGAVATRPVAAVAEAIQLSIDQFFGAGMSDFSMQIQRVDTVDPSIEPSMKAYYGSGIIRGDINLLEVSAWTRAVFSVSLLGVAAGAIGLAAARRQGLQLDIRIIATCAIIVGAIIANAAISAILSGVNDRYQGRVAWLMVLVSVLLCGHAWILLKTIMPLRTTKATPVQV